MGRTDMLEVGKAASSERKAAGCRASDKGQYWNRKGAVHQREHASWPWRFKIPKVQGHCCWTHVVS